VLSEFAYIETWYATWHSTQFRAKYTPEAGEGWHSTLHMQHASPPVSVSGELHCSTVVHELSPRSPRRPERSSEECRGAPRVCVLLVPLLLFTARGVLVNTSA